MAVSADRYGDPAAGGGAAPNVATDTDGDGLPDYIEVSDYDGDGTQEMADISAALAALTDTNRYAYVLPGNYTGPTSVSGLGSNAVIELDSYDTLECASANSVTLNGNQWISGDNATAIDRAVIGPSSTTGNIQITLKNCTVDGGYPSTWGFDSTDLDTATENIDVEDERGNDIDGSYDDHGYVTGDGPFRLVDGGGGLPTCTPACAAATDYWIIRVDADTIRLAASRANALAGTPVDITATGAGTNNRIGPDETAEALTYTGPMGWFGRGVQDARVEGNIFRHVKHTCIYHSNFAGGLISGNVMDQCGAYNNAVAGQAGAAMYLFATDAASKIAESILVIANVATRGNNGYNLRSADFFDNEYVRRILFNDNYAERLAGACLTLWSTRYTVVDGLVCNDSSSLFATDNALGTNYGDQDPTGTSTGTDNTMANVLVANITGTQLSSTSASAIQIGEYTDGLTLRNVKVDGTTRNCMSIEQPVRNFVGENIELANCEQRGLRIQGTPRYKAEGGILRNLTIRAPDRAGQFSGTDFNAILADGALSWWTIDGFHIGGGSEVFDIMSVSAATNDFTMRNGLVDCREGRYRGTLTETGTIQADDYVCNAGTLGDWFITTNANSASDCTFTAGVGAFQSACLCNGTSFTAVAIGSRDGIDVSAAMTDSEFTNIRGENCLNGYTLSFGAVAHDSVKISGVVADQEATFFEGNAGVDPMHGAVSLGSSGTNWVIDGRSLRCNDVDGTVADCMAGAEDDLAAGSVWMDDTCDAPCAYGTLCIDSNATTSPMNQCDDAGGANTWNPID